MSIHQTLSEAVQDDAQRAGERDRLLLEARRAGRPRRPRAAPAVPVRWLARLLFRRGDRVTQRAGCWPTEKASLRPLIAARLTPVAASEDTRFRCHGRPWTARSGEQMCPQQRKAAVLIDPMPEPGSKADAERLLAAPRLSPKVSVSGHVYDIVTGRVTTTVDAHYP